MFSGRGKQYCIGGIVLAAVAVFIVAVFALLSRTSLTEVSMEPGKDGINWSYELISGSEPRAVTPKLIDDFKISFPGESCRAARIRRTLNEELDGAQIGVYLYDVVCGVDVLIDGEMLYTSFTGAKRDANGFAVTDGLSPSQPETIEVYLPKDYKGRELTVVSYFPSETTEIVPIFPYLCSPDTTFAITSVENVLPVSRATLCAIMAFFTALVYVLDISNGKADNRILFLTIFYVMLFLDQSFSSIAGSYSLLMEKLNILDFASELYIAPLFFFAAFSMTSWRKWILASATGMWLVYDLIRLTHIHLIVGPFYGHASAPIILLLYLLTAAMIIIELRIRKRRFRKSDLIYIGIAAIAAVSRIVIFSAEWGGNIWMYIEQICIEPLRGYFYPLFVFIAYVCAITATVVVIIEFAKRTLRTRELINSLAEQNRYAMESYRRMTAAEEATYSARHEMRHHMIVLSGMLRNGASDRAFDYISALSEEYNELPEGQYSKNTMVNIIAGSYLDRAKAQGINVNYSFSLPETIPIADTDLCVFLTNMFENALNACEMANSSEKRYIKSKMYINGNYLFIGCENSMPYPKQKTKKVRDHGYGLENMKRIAEKYGGMLKIDETKTSFSLKSGFYLGSRT